MVTSARCRIDYSIRTIEMNEERVKLQVWDTAGNARFHTITQACYRRLGAMGILLVYDVTDRQSFENIRNWWVKDVAQHAPETALKILLSERANRKYELERNEIIALFNLLAKLAASSRTVAEMSTLLTDPHHGALEQLVRPKHASPDVLQMHSEL